MINRATVSTFVFAALSYVATSADAQAQLPPTPPPVTPPVVRPTAPAPAAVPATEAAAVKPADLIEAKNEEATAKVEEAVAKKETDEVKAALEKAETEVANVRSGKLIEYGITGGVAIGVHVPFPRSSGGTGLDTVSFATVPYVMLVPAYLSKSDALNAYCARSWIGGDFADATTAAKAKARLHAEEKLAVVTAWLSARTDGATVTAEALCSEDGDGDSSDRICEEIDLAEKDHDDGDKDGDTTELLIHPGILRAVSWYRMPQATPDQRDARDKARRAVIDVISGTTWNSTLKGSCWKHRFGVWVGRPINFSAEVHIADADPPVDGLRDVEAYVAGGVAWVPNAYISVLAGVTTYGTARADRDDPGSTEAVGAFTFGLGGNLDIASLFVQ